MFGVSAAFVVVLSCFVITADAQDPATGWMAYAVGTIPAGAERITRLEMTWKVLLFHNATFQ